MAQDVRKRTRKRPDPELGASVANDSECHGGKVDEHGSTMAAPGAPADTDLSDTPDTLRLRGVLTMLAEGRTQKEIAEHYAKDPRTIRRWVKEARRRKLALSERLTPQEALADYLYGFAAQKADLLRMKEAAAEAKNFGLALRCIRELSRHEATRMAVLVKIGLFERYAFAPASADGPNEQSAQVLLDAAQNFATGNFEVAEDSTESQVEEDDEALY